jgi:hypothetical protein
MKSKKPIPLAKELERDLVEKARGVLLQKGFMLIRNHMGLLVFGGSQATANPNRGIPDLQAIKDGRSLWIEFKRPGWKPPGKNYDSNGLPTAHAFQTNWILRLRQAGCLAEFVTSLPELDAAIKRFEGVSDERIDSSVPSPTAGDSLRCEHS